MFRRTIVLTVLAVSAMPVLCLGQGQKASSIIIHDSTGAGSGGEGATSSFRNAFKSALEREKPCVETMDDQDIRDALQDEKDRALLEGGDSNAMLKSLGERMGAGMVMSVRAMPGPGGSTMYSAFVIDARTGATLAREMGTGEEGAKQAAQNLVRDIGSSLADDCSPHWIGTILLTGTTNESRQKTDAGPMRAGARNTKRVLTETSNMTQTIKATLLSPKGGGGKSVTSPKAMVSQRVQSVFTKDSSTGGELYCRLPGQNPIWRNFTEQYKETTTQLGQGTGEMPVFISIDDDGNYSIKVTAPGGVMLGKVETSRSSSGCDGKAPTPSIDAISSPEGKLEGTSFDAVGKTSSPKPDSLAGSQTSPDGHTKVSWNLRLVKPKGAK